MLLDAQIPRSELYLCAHKREAWTDVGSVAWYAVWIWEKVSLFPRFRLTAACRKSYMTTGYRHGKKPYALGVYMYGSSE